MKRIYITLLALLVVQLATAQQDIHFSQFFNSAVSLNPAEAGMANADVRVLLNYRSQWGSIDSPYKTKSLSVDGGLMEQKLKTNLMGLGLDIFQDDSQISNIKTLGVGGSFSYATAVDRTSWLSFGLKIGLIQRSIDYRGQQWASQFNGTEFNPSLDPGITFGSSKNSSADLGAGVYYKTIRNRINDFYAGLSVDHINGSNVAFLGKEDKYLRKYTAKVGGNISKRNTNVSYQPAAIFMLQGKNKYIIVGTDIKYIISKGSRSTGINKSVAFKGGGYYRFGDAFYAHVGLSYGDYEISMSYDINLSDLSNAVGATGAMELMFIYTPALSDFRKRKRTGR